MPPRRRSSSSLSPSLPRRAWLLISPILSPTRGLENLPRGADGDGWLLLLRSSDRGRGGRLPEPGGRGLRHSWAPGRGSQVASYQRRKIARWAGARGAAAWQGTKKVRAAVVRKAWRVDAGDSDVHQCADFLSGNDC